MEYRVECPSKNTTVEGFFVGGGIGDHGLLLMISPNRRIYYSTNEGKRLINSQDSRGGSNAHGERAAKGRGVMRKTPILSM